MLKQFVGGCFSSLNCGYSVCGWVFFVIKLWKNTHPHTFSMWVGVVKPSGHYSLFKMCIQLLPILLPTLTSFHILFFNL